MFTGLESRRLRIPVNLRGWGTVEIPIPKDFRIIATLNTADRHSLFRISDALKRRFAFIEVPVASDLGEEWNRVCSHPEVLAQSTTDTWFEDLPVNELRLFNDLRRFIYLIRAFFPLGTAQLVAAVRFLQASGKRIYGQQDLDRQRMGEPHLRHG